MKAIRIVNAVVILLLMVAFLPTQQIAQAQPMLPDGIERDTRYIPGEVLVGFPVGLSATVYSTKATALAKTVGAQVVRAYANMALLSFSPDADVNAISAQLTGTGGASYAQPNYVYWTPEAGMDLRSAPVSSDGYSITAPSGDIKLSWDQVNLLRTKRATQSTFPNELKENWGFDKIQAEIIWSDTAKSPSVCVVDTGVDAKHPELSGKVVNGKDFFNNDSLPADDNGHGTQVAGIIVAKANTGAGTPLGVSNGLVLAVKSLGAQGYGSSFTIAAGIRYCADNSTVKVINLAFGNATGGAIEYNAMAYAAGKGKLMVSAAGNQSGSAKYYPAAWADPTEVIPGTPSLNTIYASVISVAAGMSPGYYDYWVDKDGLGTVDDGEIFASSQCAAPFSNYGAWADIVAPGDAILSTTPVSSPFYENFYGNTLIKQDYWGGTSMAASFVAAAAARVWSVKGLTTTPAAIKTLLMDTGNPLDFAADQNLSNDPANAWNSSAYNSPDPLNLPDNTIQAPFCWPNNNGYYGPEQDMQNAVYLNVAKAMGRMGLVAEITDAGTGLPLNGVTVTAGDITIPAKPVVKDTAILNAGGTNGKYSLVVMINLPTSDAGIPYRLQANKSGYTTGSVTFDKVSAYTDKAGTFEFDPYASVGIPVLNNNISFVLNWDDPSVDLDMFVMMPPANLPVPTPRPPLTPLPFTGIVGPGSLFGYTLLGSGLEVEGSLLLPAEVFGAGSTAAMPFAIRLHDGGNGGSTSVETIQVRGNAGAGLIPIRPMYEGNISDPYRVYVTDYSGIYPSTSDCDTMIAKDFTNCGNPVLDIVAPIVRVWVKGVVVNADRRVGVIPDYFGFYPVSGCSGDFWYAASMYVNTVATPLVTLGTQVTPQFSCGRAGDGGDFWPGWVY